ncbi:MAG: hypothetical protein ABSD42_12390 [Candidatus Bathyarchaeia archaeon]|jgi:hypothetical protein
MRLSKAWIIAARDFKIFRRVKNVWSSIIIFPVVISVLFPALRVRGSPLLLNTPVSPVAIVMSVLFSVIVSSRVNDARSASSFGIFILFPLLGIYLLSETSIITLDVNSLLIISGILLAVDVALFYVSTATFRREEILTKWK